jgi:hypothetical protein
MCRVGTVRQPKSGPVRAFTYLLAHLMSVGLLTVPAPRVKFPVLNCRTEAGVRHFDVAAMFASLWLLTSMVIDAVTPKELSVYMIGAAIAPATAISAILYWLRVPTIDFAAVFATFWMISEMLLELLSPKPLSPLMAVIAVAPLMIFGAVVNFQCWRRSKLRPIPVPPPSI